MFQRREYEIPHEEETGIIRFERHNFELNMLWRHNIFGANLDVGSCSDYVVFLHSPSFSKTGYFC